MDGDQYTAHDGDEGDARLDGILRAAPQPEPPAILRAGLYARIAAASADRAAPQHLHEREKELPFMHETDTHAESQESALRRPASRWAAWLGAVAAVLIVGLLAGLLVHQQQGKGAQPATTRCTGGADQVKVDIPQGGSIGAPVMTGANDGWAIGNTTTDAFIARYHDCRLAPATTYQSSHLNDITMVSATEGWAVGVTGGTIYNQPAARVPLLLHYVGGTWSRVAVPTPTGYNGEFTRVRAGGDGELWAAALELDQPNTPSLWHSSSGQWSSIALPARMAEITAIETGGADDLWISGSSTSTDNTGLFVHYHAGTQTQVALSKGTTIFALRMAAPGDGWAMGQVYLGGDDSGNNPLKAKPIVLHYNGHTWAPIATGADTQAFLVVSLGQGEGWAVNVATSIPQYSIAVQHEHGGRWQTVSWPYKNIVGMDLYDMTCTDSDDCWIAGTAVISVTTKGQSTTSTLQAVLLHYAQGKWYAYGPASTSRPIPQS